MTALPTEQIVLLILVFGIMGGLAVFFYFRRLKSNKSTDRITAESRAKISKDVASESESKAIPERAKEAPKSLEEVLQNTRSGFMGRFQGLFGSRSSLSENELEDIEEILYTSDLGPSTVQHLLNNLQENLDSSEEMTLESLRDHLRTDMNSIFNETQFQKTDLFESADKKPTVWMIVGVNGAGKTTTIGKIAHRLAAEKGKKVLIGAGDTFRAAAKEQLEVWSERASVDIFAPENATNPSGLAFDAAKKAENGEYDILILDTAGRLHTQQNLMDELKKVQRVLDKALPGAPHEVLLVLDANQGQNALMQAKQFHEQIGVTGVVLTKLDGTAKGGVALGVACELKLPIQLIGVGEKMDDLRPFSSKEFVDSIL